MGFRIHRGIFQKLNAERTAYENAFKMDTDGRLKPVDRDGTVTGAYLTSVPDEFLTQTEGDARYALLTAPAAPTSPATRIVGETIEVSFTASADTVDHYQVWGADGSNSFNLIAHIPPQDFGSTMTVVDTAFTSSGTRNYRIYSVRAGKYSTAATASRAFTVASLEPTNMRVTPMEEAFVVEWDAPASRFVDHYEVYHHSHATQSSLSRSSATLAYSGKNTVFVKPVDDDNYHQFWVEVATV